MEDYITLYEIYIHNPKLFKSKNLKCFIKNHKVQDHDIVLLKHNKIGIKKGWIKKHLPSFDLELKEIEEEEKYKYFEVSTTLEKYGCKTFNPITLNVDSTMVKFFLKEGKRTPYFTYKGVIKTMVLFNTLPDVCFDWIQELINGRLKTSIDNLENVSEMVNLVHIPIIKNNNFPDGKLVLSDHVYSLSNEDIVVDFKRIGDLKNEPILESVVDDYKCPLYTQLQTNFQNRLKELERNFELQLRELKQEGVIQLLQQELEKEKSLKDQAITLTQSFIPTFNESNNVVVCRSSPQLSKASSPENMKKDTIDISPLNLKSFGKLKPSKIK